MEANTTSTDGNETGLNLSAIRERQGIPEPGTEAWEVLHEMLVPAGPDEVREAATEPPGRRIGAGWDHGKTAQHFAVAQRDLPATRKLMYHTVLRYMRGQLPATEHPRTFAVRASLNQSTVYSHLRAGRDAGHALHLSDVALYRVSPDPLEDWERVEYDHATWITIGPTADEVETLTHLQQRRANVDRTTEARRWADTHRSGDRLRFTWRRGLLESDLGRSAKAVALAAAVLWNGSGGLYAVPSKADLAELAGYSSETTVRRQVRTLEGRGWAFVRRTGHGIEIWPRIPDDRVEPLASKYLDR